MKYKNLKNKNGQVMIVVSLALGGVMIVSTVIGGLLISNQIRQAGNIANSAKAFYAADSALEWGIYQFYTQDTSAGAPDLTNATYITECYSRSATTSCVGGGEITDIVGKGIFGKVSRALQISF
jgi:hypothetical protein